MKNLKLNYLVVGSFMVGVLALLLVAVALLTGRTGATDNYFAVYNNVTGVEFGTRILYEGYPVGQVEDILPRQADGKTRFHVDLGITKDWKIPKDSVAEIAASGILAAVTINVRAGQSTEFLTPGTEIQSRESSNVMATVGDLARDIKELTESDIKPMLARFNAIIQGIGDVVGGQENPMGNDMRKMVDTVTKTTPEIIDNINTFSSRLETLLSDRNLKAMDAIIANMGSSAKNMAGITEQLSETRKSVDGLLATISTMVVDNKLDVERAVIDMRHSAETVARYIESINQNLDLTSRNMMEFSRALRQNPGLLLGSTPPADNAAPER